MADEIKREQDTEMASIPEIPPPTPPPQVEVTSAALTAPAIQPEQTLNNEVAEQSIMGASISASKIKIEPGEVPPTALENRTEPHVIDSAMPSVALGEDVDVTMTGQSAPVKKTQTQDGINHALANLAVTSQEPKKEAPVERVDEVANRVSLKEGGVGEALKGLANIRSSLEKCPAANADNFVPAWFRQLKTIVADAKKFEFLVGVAGGTGMGKSSLLNALIGQPDDLAPSSQNGACTAAVCCFRYQDPKEADRTFLAKVRFKSKETVDKELVDFFQDYKEWHDDTRFDAQIDSNVHAERDRLRNIIDIIQGWSGLDTEKIIQLGTADKASEITNQCVNGRNFFNFKKPNQNEARLIGSNLARNFLQEVRPYIGNTKKKLETLLWPLVEIVDIYLDAPILRNGIVLVDLPGESDALESRAQIARDFYNRVDRLMIITPSDRACDNQTAAELIRDDQVVDLEADGKMAGDGLCVVVTKIDLMKWEDFVTQEWDPTDVSAEFPKLMEKLESLKEECQKLNGEIEALRENLDGPRNAFSRSRKSRFSFSHRSRDPASPEEAAQIQQLTSLEEKLQDVEYRMEDLDEQCLRACIDARNRDIEEKMQKGIQRRRQDMLGVQEAQAPNPVNVFPVSSHAHRSLLKGKTEPAFPDAQSTGILALEQWMVKGSLEKRGQHADAILTRCQALYDQISEWSLEEWQVKSRLPESEFPRIEGILNTRRSVLKISLEKWVREAATLLNSHDTFKASLDGPLSWKNQGTFLAHIRSFNQSVDGGKMHWGTYGACIRRYGGLYKTSKLPRQIYDWQGSTYALYWKPHLGYWTRTFNEEYNENREKIVSIFQKVVEEHMEQMLGVVDMPQAYMDAFQQYMGKVKSARESSRIWINQATDGFRNECQDIRQRSRDLLNGPFMEAYREAQSHTGRGRNARQIATMDEYANPIREKLETIIKAEICQMLGDAHEGLTDAIIQVAEAYKARIYEIATTVAKNVCSLNTKVLQDSTSFTEVQNLKKSILEDVETWRQKCWTLKVKWLQEEAGPLEQSVLTMQAETFDIKQTKRPIEEEDAAVGASPAKILRLK